MAYRFVSLSLRVFVFAVAALTSASLSAGAAPQPPPSSRISWQADLRVQRAERIFASPHDVRRVWVATPAGICETLDDGANWTLLPGTAREQLGQISDAVFLPYNASAVLLATRDKGVFRSDDNGKTWRNAGTPASGLKSPHVLRLLCDTGDRCSRILYATHGGAAPGLSKSVDGGNSWFALAEQLYFHELLLEGKELFAAAQSEGEEDVWGIWHSFDGGGVWAEVLRDVRPTVAGCSRVHWNGVWFGTLKGRVLFRPPLGRDQMIGEWQKVGPAEPAQWASIFGAFGRNPDDDVMYAYDPHRHGLLASRDGFKTWWSENHGLFVDRFVKDGANVCASAAGTTFYASINGQLYIGRTFGSAAGPNLINARVEPGVLRWKKDLPVSFSVKAEPRAADAKAKIKEIHVGLAAIKGPGNFALFDDGKHNDGAAGDGLYAATFNLPADCPLVPPAKRQYIPGPVLLPVVARDAANRASSTLLPLTIQSRGESAVLWNGENVRWGVRLVEGRRPFHFGLFDDTYGTMIDVGAEARTGKRCLHVYASRGPWLIGWGQEGEGWNFSDLDYLSFWIKVVPPNKGDIKVMLVDTPGGQDESSVSAGVWLLKDGYLKEMPAEYQQVRIPISKFLKRTGFDIDLCGGFAFGGDDPKGQNFFVDDLVVEIEGAPVPSSEKK